MVGLCGGEWGNAIPRDSTRTKVIANMPLTGTYVRSIDEKQRVAVPKRYRDELLAGESTSVLYLAPESDRSLALFAPRVFEERARRLANVSGPSGHLKTYMRLYYSQAEQVEVDSQGRIRVPERLARFAGLRQDVVLLGVHDHIEVWDQERWDQFLATHGSEFDQLASEAFA